MGGTKQAPFSVGCLVIIVIEGCVEGVALLLIHLVEGVDTGLEDLHELGTGLNIVFEINILSVHLGLNITIFTISKPSRVIATSASESLTRSTWTSSRATVGKASSIAATSIVLLEVNICF